ncbi:MAG: TolC family protein, partial [Nevskia sp.]|nr:TolC family protein [Nevskia sp.]
PLAARVEATLAEYRGGTGTFAAVLDSRQALLDAELALLELHLQRLRAELKLHYFAAGR